MKKDLKDTLIQTMFKALYHEGYNASNLNDLLKTAGTSKGGLYHYYSSKKELALETTRIIVSDFIHHYWETGLSKGKNPITALETLLKGLPETPIVKDVVFDFQYGCPLNNLIQEMSAIDDDFHTLLNTLFDAWVNVVAEAFYKAQKEGVIQKKVDTKAIAEFTVASIEGCLSMSKVHRRVDDYNNSIDTLITLLRSIETK